MTLDVAPAADEGQAKPAAKLRRSERFFRDIYSPIMLKKVGGYKVVAILIVLGFATYAAFSFYWASLLQTPESEEEWFQSSHMFTGINDYQTSRFMAATSAQYVDVGMTWGVAGINRDDFVRWEPSKNRGTAIFDDSFDLTTKEAQDHILDTCARLRTYECAEPGCLSGTTPRTLVLEARVTCFLEEYQQWHNATTGVWAMPTGAAFLSSLKAFRALNPQHATNIGVINGDLKFASISMITSLIRRQPHGVTEPVFQVITKFVEETNARAPASAKTAVFKSMWFGWMKTEEGLVSGMFIGLALSSPVAFLVLCAATDNLYLAFYAVVCIAGIVAAVLGAGQHFMGWSLGVAESISAVIVIGFSVDYVVHLGHMYAESESNDRESRMTHSATTMGVTVLAGAITTFGAGIVMLFCQMVFFTKMATLISMTIAFSFLTAMGPFMAAVALFGPEGDQGRISVWLKQLAVCLGIRQQKESSVSPRTRHAA